jgi:predicted ferric reductase
MKKIQLTFIFLIIALTGLWLLAEGVLTTTFETLASWTSLLYYSGIIGIGVMSVSMILAVRPVVVEPYLGGLDKMYRLHKWLGITGLVFSIIHWLSKQAPKWILDLAGGEPPAREASPEQTVAIFKFFQTQRGLAEVLGEWAFYAAVVLIVLALVKYFPYRYFFKTHHILAAIYLILVFHSIVLMKFTYWGEVIGPVMAVLMIAGTAAAFISLFRRVGASRRVVGEIEELIRHPDLRVMEVVTMLKSRWSGHQAGQFAFVTFDQSEGPHPFTITSAWKGDGSLRFIVKELGDYTNTLPATSKVGDAFKVEGPYGQFNFRGNEPRQIWVGGGIGISAFVARMKTLADHPDGKIVDLFHTTTVFDEGGIAKLQSDAKAANVRLHILVDAKDGLLNAERICQVVPEWKSATVWFCGPAGFGRAMRNDFTAIGLSPGDFHQELFDMR